LEAEVCAARQHFEAFAPNDDDGLDFNRPFRRLSPANAGAARPKTLGGIGALADGLVKDGPSRAAAARRRESVVLDEAGSQSRLASKDFRARPGRWAAV